MCGVLGLLGFGDWMIHHDRVAWDNRRMMLFRYINSERNEYLAVCLDSSLLWCCCDGAEDWNVLVSVRISTHNSVESSTLNVAVLAHASVQSVAKTLQSCEYS